jgi:dTDP-D-glucose 4,6-dehydratase
MKVRIGSVKNLIRFVLDRCWERGAYAIDDTKIRAELG